MSELSLLPHVENLGNLPTSELWARAAACPISALGLLRSRLQEEALIFCTWDRSRDDERGPPYPRQGTSGELKKNRTTVCNAPPLVFVFVILATSSHYCTGHEANRLSVARALPAHTPAPLLREPDTFDIHRKDGAYNRKPLCNIALSTDQCCNKATVCLLWRPRRWLQ